jgi:hypothetical protein
MRRKIRLKLQNPLWAGIAVLRVSERYADKGRVSPWTQACGVVFLKRRESAKVKKEYLQNKCDSSEN